MESKYISDLRQKGFRITQARTAILELFENTKKPISASSIHSMLLRLGVNVNITTVYREIEFLVEKEILEKIPLKDSELYYELKDREHHHHLLCTSCGTIEDIALKSEKKLLEEVQNSTKYSINRHNISFFGYCPKCK
jgi:Fur family ferric uptake transcriptional regulator